MGCGSTQISMQIMALSLGYGSVDQALAAGAVRIVTRSRNGENPTLQVFDQR